MDKIRIVYIGKMQEIQDSLPFALEQQQTTSIQIFPNYEIAS